MENGRGLFVARRDAGETRIPFDIPASRLAPERRHELEQVGETDDGVVVALDRYASRAEPGSPRCADGRETFLRAFSLPMRRQVFARQVESCLAGVPRTPVEWLGDGRLRAGPSTLTIADGGRKIAESTGG